MTRAASLVLLWGLAVPAARLAAAAVVPGAVAVSAPAFVSGAAPVRGAAPAAVPADSFEARLPVRWLQDDPADSLYRLAHDALNRRDYGGAAARFRQIVLLYPGSGYASDALYWRAFALYRVGGDAELREALRALRSQRERFPRAAARGDGPALEQRIQGELARRGDPAAAEAVARNADRAAGKIAEQATRVARRVAPSIERTLSAVEARGGGICNPDEDDAKIAALNALLQVDAARARTLLRQVLAQRDEGTVCLRRKAVFLVARQRGEGAEEIMLDAARSDPDAEVRAQAVFWLSQARTTRAVIALDSILHATTETDIRQKVVFALSQHNTPRAQQALRNYAAREDVPEEARERAIFWLGQTASAKNAAAAKNAAFLRDLYPRLRKVEIKRRILASISQMGGAQNAQWLLGLARDNSESVELRRQALFWAAQSGVPTGDLIALYGATEDATMREQLILAYTKRTEPGALDKLVEIATRDPNLELRKKALFWIGQSRDPRAARALQELAKRQ